MGGLESSGPHAVTVPELTNRGGDPLGNARHRSHTEPAAMVWAVGWITLCDRRSLGSASK
jgi:hypothetical protein